jgi:hypothetical protein
MAVVFVNGRQKALPPDSADKTLLTWLRGTYFDGAPPDSTYMRAGRACLRLLHKGCACGGCTGWN